MHSASVAIHSDPGENKCDHISAVTFPAFVKQVWYSYSPILRLSNYTKFCSIHLFEHTLISQQCCTADTLEATETEVYLPPIFLHGDWWNMISFYLRKLSNVQPQK